MPFVVEECTDADMPRAFELLSLAFGHEHPYIEAVFPAHETAEGRRIGGERFLGFRKADPFATNIKAVDMDTGKMIGHARWIVCNGALPPESELSGDYWETDEQKEFAAWMYGQYLAPRREAIKKSGGNIVSLDLMTIDPEYQRQGAGRALLKWGIEVADKLEVEAVVEATDPGLGLYKSAGYEVKYRYEVSLPEKWAGRETQWFWWMVRAKQTSKGTI